jgi:hypothetical protein
VSAPLRVFALIADLEGCGYQRVSAPGQAVNALSNGLVRVETHQSARAILGGTPGNRKCLKLRPLDADVVVLQRPMFEDIVALIPKIKAQGCAVVVDIDDDIERVPTTNYAYELIHPRTSPGRNWQWLQKACAQADLLTCSTPALTRYARGECMIVPNGVPAKACTEPKVEHEGVTAGWTGNVGTHPHDLEVPRGAVGRAVEKTGAEFMVIGQSGGVRDQLRLPAEPIETGWLSLRDYYTTLPRLDAGIVPLEDTAFNCAKSCLKGMEMSAAGVPFLASPLPEYRALAAQGVGQLVTRPREWEAALTRLLTDQPYREDTGAAYREVIRTTRTFERNWWRWAEAWHHALKLRRPAHATA